MFDTTGMTDHAKQIIKRWLYNKYNADYWKKQEQEARKEVVNAIFPNPRLGTNSVATKGGKLKAQFSKNLKVDSGKTKVEIDLALENADVPKDLVVWKPSVSVSVWNALTSEQKNALSEIVEEKPATPTMTFEQTEDQS